MAIVLLLNMGGVSQNVDLTICVIGGHFLRMFK